MFLLLQIKKDRPHISETIPFHNSCYLNPHRNLETSLLTSKKNIHQRQDL